MTQRSVNSVIEKINEMIKVNRLILPNQPDILIALQKLNEKPDININDLKTTIMRDPVLTARIISIANSPLTRGQMDIKTIETAISRLGIKFVISIGMGLTTNYLYQAKNKLIGKRMHETWDVSTNVAATSYVLAQYFKIKTPEDALLAGLLHEIGVLPILTQVEKMFYADATNNNQELTASEIKNFETTIQENYGKLSDSILSLWNFPSSISSVALNLNNLYRCPIEPDLSDVILVAKIHVLGDREHPLTKIDKNKLLTYERLDLDPNVKLEDIPQLQKQLENAKALFM